MLIDIVVKPLWARGKTPLDSELRKMSESRELSNNKIDTLQKRNQHPPHELPVKWPSYLAQLNQQGTISAAACSPPNCPLRATLYGKLYVCPGLMPRPPLNEHSRCQLSAPSGFFRVASCRAVALI